MEYGTLYGIGIGPGDPELITVKGAKILARCRHVVVPKSSDTSASLARDIIRGYLSDKSEVHELVFPMTRNKEQLERYWQSAANFVAQILAEGEDVAYASLGDAMLYSTYVYLVRALRRIMPAARVVTIPGVSSVAAAAAVAEFPLGEGNDTIRIIPVVDDKQYLRDQVEEPGTAVFMKIGRRLKVLLDAIKESNSAVEAVFASRATMQNQRVERSLEKLEDATEEAGYLSVLLVRCRGPKE